MASESKSFVPRISTENISLASAAILHRPRRCNSHRLPLIEVGIVFGLILVAVWTPQGRVNAYICWTAAFATVVLSLPGRYSARELGLIRPFSGALTVLLAGSALVGLIAALGFVTRSTGPPQPLPWMRAWQYGIWALLQQFILESFIYVRLGIALWSTECASRSILPLCRCSSAQSIADRIGIPGRALLLRDVSPLSQHLSARHRSRRPRINDCCQPAKQRAAPHARRDRIPDVSSLILYAPVLH